MSELKTFEKADLLQLWQEAPADQVVGEWRTLERKSGQIGLGESPDYEVVVHEVSASTRVFWCERFKMCLIEQALYVGNGAPKTLPESHLFRAHTQPRITTIMHELSSARLMRQVVEMADAWRREVASAIPETNLRQPREGDARAPGLVSKP